MISETTHTAPPLVTAGELLRLSTLEHDYELVRGRLIVRPFSSGRHGIVTSNLVYRAGDFIHVSARGMAFAKAGFWIRSDPDTVRAPDFAFVAEDRASLVPRAGHARLAPDLVAEVVDHDDRPGEVLAKVADWLDTGTRLVWVIDPERFEAHIYRSDGMLSVLGADGSLDGEDVLPGFTCPLREILD